MRNAACWIDLPWQVRMKLLAHELQMRRFLTLIWRTPCKKSAFCFACCPQPFSPQVWRRRRHLLKAAAPERPRVARRRATHRAILVPALRARTARHPAHQAHQAHRAAVPSTAVRIPNNPALQLPETPVRQECRRAILQPIRTSRRRVPVRRMHRQAAAAPTAQARRLLPTRRAQARKAAASSHSRRGLPLADVGGQLVTGPKQSVITMRPSPNIPKVDLCPQPRLRAFFCPYPNVDVHVWFSDNGLCVCHEAVTGSIQTPTCPCFRSAANSRATKTSVETRMYACRPDSLYK